MLYKKTNKGNFLIANKIVYHKGIWSQGTGLTFHRKIKDEAHIFPFNKPRRVALTMFFVFFTIDAIFLDKNKKIIEIIQDFKPFSNYNPKKEASFVIELPEHTIETRKLKIGDEILIKE